MLQTRSQTDSRVLTYIVTKGVQLIHCPARSPDLSLIENLLSWICETMSHHHSPGTTIDDAGHRLGSVLNNLPVSVFETQLDSMSKQRSSHTFPTISSRVPGSESISATESENFNYKSDNCISTSGNQKLCDELDNCIQKLPQTLLDNFNECLKQTYSDGKLGKCNDKENLFGTSKQLQQYFQCFLNKLPQKSDLSDDERKQFDKTYKPCMLKVGKKCLGSKK
ncbi:uncharacterized protein TNCV_395951 [Trichonephila clavipes]|nr:uncharacterized protein TNCV_395951 [Trichonephila clavipes]